MINSERKYIERVQKRELETLLKIFPAVLIEGAKAVGKSTLGEMIASSALYMQNPEEMQKNLAIAKLSVSSLLDGDKPRLLDEWQMAPSLWDAVRFESDKSGGMPGQFILTGSSTPTENAVMHSGTGRIARMKLYPMSLLESGESNGKVSLESLFKKDTTISGKSDLDLGDIVNAIVRGGWPTAIKAKSNEPIFVFSYVSSIINSDFVLSDDETKKNPEKLRVFLHSYARGISSRVTNETIRKDVASQYPSFSEKTFYSYKNALERIYVIDELNPWSTALRSKATIRTTPVRHFVDPSIASVMLGANRDDLLKDPQTLGFLFESLVIRDLRVYASAFGASVSSYRDSNSLEADAIVHTMDGKWIAVEVKLGESWIEEGARSLKKLYDTVISKPEAMVVIIPTGYAYKREDGVFVVPISCLAS